MQMRLCTTIGEHERGWVSCPACAGAGARMLHVVGRAEASCPVGKHVPASFLCHVNSCSDNRHFDASNTMARHMGIRQARATTIPLPHLLNDNVM
jgi:hypothetical protein